ncbi:MAG: alpha/beta hydrolase family protein [Phycisphaerales bacterium]
MPRSGFITSLVLGAITVLGLSGCSFYSGGDPARGTHALAVPELPDDTWPVRTTGELLHDLDALTPDRVTLAVPYRARNPHEEGSAEYRLDATIVAHGVYGRGLMREFGSVVPLDGSPPSADTLSVPPELLEGMQFVSVPRSRGLSSETLRRFREEQPDRYRRMLLGRLGLRPGAGDTWTLGVRGTRMRLYEPTGRFAGKLSRGLVIHLSSLSGLEYELPVVSELNARGWAVLVINASTARRDEPPVYVNPDAGYAGAGRRLAAMIDNRVAEIAYAAEAGVEFLTDHKHLVQTSNLVVIGYSAGALTAPAVAELLGARVSAVVLVGGGANLLDISQRSTLTNGGIELVWKDNKQTPEFMRQLCDAYLTQSKLDPYTLAPRLCCKPVLMLHGAFDDIIPSDTGAMLRQRLGNCECYTYTLGHRGVFLFLPGQAKRIASWLDSREGAR